MHQALVRFDPETARNREEAAKNHRDVVFDYHDGDTLGSASLYATLDPVDAHDLDATISDLAHQLGRLGDQSPLGHRRAAALGLLAHPQRALDLFGQPADPDHPTAESKDLAITGATLYVHLDRRRPPTVRPRTCERPRRPTSRSSAPPPSTSSRPGSQRFSGITLKPVLDMSKSRSSTDAVDQHDPPEWMRDLVILRDGHCVFPGCNVDARRCDQDHIEPYIPMDEGGPPGQTSPANLACLCRRHHRLKTFTSWRYERAGPGTYHWTNPHGLTYQSRPTSKG